MKIINKIKELSFKQRVISITTIAFVLIAISSIILGITFSANKVNIFKGIELNDVNIGNINISSINIQEENGITKYEAKILATEDTSIKYIKIIMKDEENKEIVSLIGYVGSTISNKESKEIEASTDADLSKIKSIEYEIK